MDKYRIENVVCYPFRTAILVDNGTIEGQIGEGCKAGALEQLVEEQQEQAGDGQADQQGGDSPQSDQEPAA